MHIGLIGGIGPAATEFYYRGLVKAYASANKRMALTIAHADTRELVRNMEEDARETQARIFEGFAEQLKAGGCEAIAVTSMGGHFCINELEKISPLPILNAIPELDAYFGGLVIKRVGVLGSRAVMESNFYNGVSSVEVVAPAADELGAVHAEYVAMATAGIATEKQREFFDRAARKLCREQGAELIVLGGTDLFLAFGDEDHGYPIVDCAQIHVDAIARVSMGGD